MRRMKTIRPMGRLRRWLGHHLIEIATTVDPSRVAAVFDVESHPDSKLQRHLADEGITDPVGVMSQVEQTAHIEAGIEHYHRLVKEHRRLAYAERELARRAPELYAGQALGE